MYLLLLLFTFIVNFLLLNINEYLKLIIISIESVFLVDLFFLYKSNKKKYLNKVNIITILLLLINAIFVTLDSYTKIHYTVSNIINQNENFIYPRWVASSNFYYILNYDAIVNFIIIFPILFFMFIKTIKNNI